MPKSNKRGQLEFGFSGGPVAVRRRAGGRPLFPSGPPETNQTGLGLNYRRGADPDPDRPWWGGSSLPPEDPEAPEGWRETLARLFPDSYVSTDPGRYSWAELCERFPDVAAAVQVDGEGEAQKV